MKYKILAAGLLAIAACSARAATDANGLVILLTDYGTDSVYVGALKGAIYAKFPEARIDAITNSVPQFDIAAGAFILEETCGEFPPGTTFCCVVDPGVGSARKCIVIETDSGHYFVAPDNGLLWLVAEKFGVRESRECTNRDLWRGGSLSHTFHGRDIFGPVAACIARGVPISKVGTEIEQIEKVDFGECRVEDDAIHGEVARIDPYGNIATNIDYRVLYDFGLEENDVLEVTIGNATFQAPLKRTYGDVPKGDRLALIQSLGYLEFAVNMDSLAEAIDADPKAAVTVRKAD